MFWTLCLLACAGVVQVAGAPEATSEQCDRSQSREAVWIIDKVIAPLLEKHDYKLPAECHLDSALDMFAKQERHKKLVRKGVWRCDFDNKVFRGEAFVDKHMDHKHGGERDDLATSCLAAHCNALSCAYFQAFKAHSESLLRHTPCHQATTQTHKRACQDLAYTCFPSHGGSSAQALHGFFMQNFCEALTCNWRTRDKLLRPLARENDGGRVLWAVVMWAVVAALALIYGLLFCHWNGRQKRTSLWQALGVKPKTDKLY